MAISEWAFLFKHRPMLPGVIGFSLYIEILETAKVIPTVFAVTGHEDIGAGTIENPGHSADVISLICGALLGDSSLGPRVVKETGTVKFNLNTAQSAIHLEFLHWLWFCAERRTN